MKTETEVQIRKLRKKLRQIENLERLSRELSPEEQYKISKKDAVRSELLELLSSSSTDDGCMTTALSAQSGLLDSTVESREDNWEDEREDEEDEDEEDEEVEPPTDNVSSTTSPSYTDEEKLQQRDNDQISGASNAGPINTDRDSPELGASPPKKPRGGNQITQSQPSEQKGAPAKPKAPNPLKVVQKRWASSVWSVRNLEGHNDLVCAVSVCGDRLLTGSRDTTVRLWTLSGFSEVRSLGGHTGTVNSVLLLDNKQSQLVVQNIPLDHNVSSAPSIGISGSTDCSIKIWDLHTGEMLKSIYAFSPVTKLAFTIHQGKPCLLSGTEGGKVELWDLASGSACQTIRAHDDAVTGLTACGAYVYSASTYGDLHVYHLREDSTLHTVFVSENVKLTSGLPLLWRHVRSLVAHKDVVYYGDDAMNVKAVDWKEGVAYKLPNHTTEFGATDAIIASNDLDLLLSSGYDLDNGIGFVNVRQLSSEKYLCSLCDDATSRIVALACSRVSTNEGQAGDVTIVTGGMELVVWTQVSGGSGGESDSTIRAQYVPHFTRPAHHSDVESDTEEEEDQNEMSLEQDEEEVEEDAADATAVSAAFHLKRGASADADNKGWMSWCVVL